ncbi:MAG: exosortase system-associated protein, TIGR04073 family [Candidatus Omnitrophota bacterium]|nr:exosortase system-associated protein, TIGR04073 family [Candidatus Omnitrophota bacterium]
MAKRLRVVSAMGLIAALLFFSVTAHAGEETLGDYSAEIGTKFGRGLVNIVSSLAEIPCTIADDVKDTGAVGSITGFGKGLAFMLRRILVGVTEVGTFMIPMERTIPPVCQSPSPSIAQQ